MTMAHSATFEQLQKVTTKLNAECTLLKHWQLTGGVSALVIGFELQLPDGSTQKMLLRQHGNVDRAANPHIASDEFTLLSHLHSAGLPVPQPYLHDHSGEIFTVPYLVMALVDGETVFEPPDRDAYLRQMALMLARIHHVARDKVPFLPNVSEYVIGWLNATSDKRIRDTLTQVWPLPQMNEAALLHGDYWPGNLLWREGELVAIIDWEDAKLGDPLADVANARLELLWAFGEVAMQQFTSMYQAVMSGVGFHHLPYWDLVAALRHPPEKIKTWGLDAEKEKTMFAQWEQFVVQAVKGF